MLANEKVSADGVFRCSAAALIACLFLLGCRRTEPVSQQAATPTSSATSSNAVRIPLTAEERATVTARYVCEDGTRIAILREHEARIAMSDGRVVNIGSIRNSVPPTFEDFGLVLVLVRETGGAELSDDTDRTLPCERTDS